MSSSTAPPDRKLAIIGAGAAGLVTAKTLMQAGLDVTVFEKGSAVGGIWVYDNDNGRRYVYENLRINTARRLTEFSDFPFPDGAPRVPGHRDMATYLRDYADHFGVTARIVFRSEVTQVRPLSGRGADGPRWLVEVAGEKERAFDSVIVCTGHFGRPRHLPQLLAFGGEYLHSSEYREPQPLVGKRVCVVGAGNSAVDIASDICNTSQATVLVARSGVFVVPQFVFGTSLNEISVQLQRRWIPASLRRWIIGLLVKAVHGRMVDHGFKPLAHRVHPTISSTIIQDIVFGRVAVKQGVSNIDGRRITFADGTVGEFDTLIAATGFEAHFPFLSAEIVKAGGGRVELFKRMVPPGWPGLYFVGIINLDTPINYACERQARWITEIELGNAALPSKEEMSADSAAKARWVRRYYGEALRHSVQEESASYYRELDRELRQGRRRLKHGPRKDKPQPTRPWPRTSREIAALSEDQASRLDPSAIRLPALNGDSR